MSETDKELGHLPKKTWWERLLAFILIIITIGLTFYVIQYMKNSKPKTAKKPPQAIKGVVEVINIPKKDVTLTVEGLGYIKAASEIVLKSEVSGNILYLNENIIPGHFLKKGDLVAKIDDSDYKIILMQKQANYEKALADLEIEKGSQEVARKELNLAKTIGILDNTSSDNSLTLRQPYLNKALAAVKLAKAEVALAENNLNKTNIYAPFDIVVTEKYVSEGTYLSNQSQILKGSYQHEVWAEISIPYSVLKFLDIENQNRKDVLIRLTNDSAETIFKGKFVKVIPEIEQNGLMTKILVSVKDPYSFNNKPLLLGSKIKATFQGVTLKGIYKVTSSYIRDNKKVFIADNNTLKIKDVNIVYEDDSYAYIDNGLTDNDLIVINNLSNAVENMPLQIIGDK